MYSDEQKREHIRELQRYLYEISFYNKRIPAILPDGIYGTETALAVEIFQKSYGLASTGSADNETYDKISKVHNYFYTPIKKPDVFKRDSMLIPGSNGPVVYQVQIMLNAIGKRYLNMPVTSITGIYDAPTEHAVNIFKNLSGNEGNGEGIDVELWNAIVSQFNMMV